jgi:hypothetical protein
MYVVGNMDGLTYIANHAVFQRLVGGLIEFRPACDAYQVVLVGWSSSGIRVRHVRVTDDLSVGVCMVASDRYPV